MADFAAFARKAGLESPMQREMLWHEHYRAAHPDVFAGLDAATAGSSNGLPAMVRELSRVRGRVKEAEPVMRGIVEALDPKLGELMGMASEPSPLHVLMVGGFTTNSAVGRVGDDVAVFHCLEWFQSADGARALIGHETAHAWHRLALRRTAQRLPPDDDLAWMIFSEGLATQASRAAAPGLSEVDYFWYGHPEVGDWIPWCAEHSPELLRHLAAGLDSPDAVETYFGAGLIDGRWRVGYYLADQVVGGLGLSLSALVQISVDDARQAVTDLLTTAAADRGTVDAPPGPD